jgi:hypothetical protein
MIDVLKEYVGKWAVVDVGTGVYIGRVVSEEGGDIQLSPVFDYVSRLVRNGNSVARDSMVFPHDLCTSFNANLIVKNALTVMYLDDMDDSDREQYEVLIKRGADLLMAARASKSGITLTGQMPNNQPNKPLIKM